MSKQRAYALAEKLGATISEGWGTMHLDAPDFKRFGGTNHAYAYDISDGIKNPWSNRTVWQEILDDLKQPLIDCDETGCEMCGEAAAK